MEILSENWQHHFSELCKNQSFISIILTGVVLLSSIFYYFFKTRGLPPGPVGLPILGYWPFLKNHTMHFTIQKMQKKYGDLFCFNYAGALFINMGSVKVVRDLHIANADCFERVHDFSLFNVMFKDGVGFINGESWKVQRKFTLQKFKELGMTTLKDSMGGPIYDSIQETIDYLKTKNGDPVDIIKLLTDKCNAILRRTLFGDCGITEEEVHDVNESYGLAMSFMTMSNMVLTGNLAKYILIVQPGYRNAMKHHRNMVRIITEVINRHKTTFDEDHPRDFIDAYFKERNERRSRGDPTAEYFTDEALVGSFLQFVGDGVLGVASFVSSFLKYVVDHEEEQDKIYSELIDIVGRNRSPTIDDKNKLHYTNAFILEVLRVSDFFPMFPSQQCIKETTVQGYRIPKGAITLLHTYACHFNPDTYEEPEKFNPSRFIPRDGKSRPELPITFGLGKRSCIGEGFTMVQVFLFLTTIIKNFKLSIPENTSSGTSELFISDTVKFCAKLRN